MGRVEYLGGIVYIISLGLLDSKMVILLVFIELYIDWNHLNGRKSVVAFDAIAFLARHTTMSRSYWEIPSRDEQGFWGDVVCFFFLE